MTIKDSMQRAANRIQRLSLEGQLWKAKYFGMQWEQINSCDSGRPKRRARSAQ